MDNILHNQYRYKIVIEYDGSAFSGWQSQNCNKPGVQDIIEKAISQIGFHNTRIFGAGRTDSGVHALGQVAHFDLDQDIITKNFIKSLNHFIKPFPAIIISCEKITKDFDARFSAKSRKYMYKIVNRKSPLIINHNRAWHVPYDLDIKKIQEAAQLFIGKHNFNNFRLKSCQATNPIRTIDNINIEIFNKYSLDQNKNIIENDDYKHDIEYQIIFHLQARSFLHRQVRMIVGALCAVGRYQLTKEDIIKLLNPNLIDDNAAKYNIKNYSHAPPHGLYFVSVTY